MPTYEVPVDLVPILLQRCQFRIGKFEINSFMMILYIIDSVTTTTSETNAMIRRNLANKIYSIFFYSATTTLGTTTRLKSLKILKKLGTNSHNDYHPLGRKLNKHPFLRPSHKSSFVIFVTSPPPPSEPLLGSNLRKS